MKKKLIILKRLSLNKDKVTNLNDGVANQVVGGFTPTFRCCSITCAAPGEACGSKSADTCCITQDVISCSC